MCLLLGYQYNITKLTEQFHLENATNIANSHLENATILLIFHLENAIL